MMDHPNIAKVLDAGMVSAASRAAHDAMPEDEPISPARLAGPTGRPYFVMELVQGVPITEYCDQCNLSTRERLELFITVCQAVQHAHQKGIIHRDIKPTNVLVAIQDGQPAPKIIDFGVAKAIDQQLTEHTLTIAFAQMVGTPLYMSPEQAELSPLGVDTRSDIYSLGVVLYELLTGATPFDKDRLKAASYDELRRIIREEEPPRPSARISTLAANLSSTVAEHRRSDTRCLRQQVRGELDWIVMKCLEKDRNRRYETPSSLARDIERYLHDEPVQACPPSVPYRLKKFIRRNKAAAAFVGLLITGVAALAVSNIQSHMNEQRAITESARANAVAGLLQEMLGSADAARAKGVDYKVRELLDDYSAGLGTQLSGQPQVEADIRATIGRAYRSLKLPDKAQPHFENAIERQRQIDGPHSEKLAAILVDGAWNLLDQGRRDEAESQLHDALAIYRNRGVSGAPLFHALEILQHILRGSEGREADAERVTQEALEVARRSGQQFPDQANLLHRYADLKIRQGKFVEAEQLARQAVDMHYRLHSDRHPETAFGLKTLARALSSQQKLADAEAAVRDALIIFRRQFPDDHDNVRDTISQLRTILEARGDKPALEALAKEEAVYAMRSGTPEYHIRLADLLTRQSISVLNTDDAERLSKAADARSEEAHRQFREAIEAYDRMAKERPDDLERRYRALDGYLLTLGYCAPVPGFEGEVDELTRRLEAELPKYLADFPDSIECQWNAAMCYLSWQRVLPFKSEHLPAIEQACGQAADILQKLSLSVPDRPNLWVWLAYANTLRAYVHWQLGNFDAAAAPLRTGMEIYDQHAEKIDADIAAKPYPAIHLEIVNAHLFYAMFLVVTNREQEAAEFVRKATLRAQRLTEPVELVAALWIKGLLQLRLGDEAGYRETCQALVDVPVNKADELTKMRTVTTWCYGPDALADMTPVLERAEQLVANNSVFDRHAVLYELGMALYRAGKYDRAEVELKASIEAYPEKAAPGWDTIDFQRLYLAMTKWKQGQQDEARRRLAEALPSVDKYIQNPATWPHYRIALELLRREAVDLIKSNDKEEAAEKNSRTGEEPKQ
jgi:serine/threonine protein kinase